jgi:hypothetical protein
MEKADGRAGKVLSVINTKETTALIKSMASEFSPGQVGTFTKVNIKKMKEMAMEK